LFKQFQLDIFHDDNITIPISSETLALFIAYLNNKQYAAATVLSYISAIGFVHRMAMLPDPSKTDLIKLTLRGYSKIMRKVDRRLPITLPLLEQLLDAVNHTVSSDYQRKMIRAMCATAFFAALRVGEITTRSGQPPRTLLG